MKKLTDQEKAFRMLQRCVERCSILYEQPQVRVWRRTCDRRRVLLEKWQALLRKAQKEYSR